jgi:hypothetical protein
MDLFMPSKKILEAICWDKNSHRQYTTFPSETPELGLSEYVGLVIDQIKSFYYHHDVKNSDNLNTQIIGTLVFDALTNAQIHGSKKGTPFTHGLFIARKGICNGFKDEGDYFKSPEIKKQYENKLKIRKFDKTKGHHGIGVNLNIFPNSDLIEVDTKKGILYCAQYLDNLL